MTDRLRSSIYADGWRALFRLLTEQAWPTAELPGAQPVVVAACDLGKDSPAEWVLMITETVSSDQQSIVLGERRRDETFLFELAVGTELHWGGWLDALDRLEDLTGTIERLIHETAPRQQHPVELAGAMTSWEVLNVSPRISPDPDGGYSAGATVTIRLHARLKPT